MRVLCELPINCRLWLIPSVSLRMLIALATMTLQQRQQHLWMSKLQKTPDGVESALGNFAYFWVLEQAGPLIRDQAQERAKRAVRCLGCAGQGYQFIQKLGRITLMNSVNMNCDRMSADYRTALACFLRVKCWGGGVNEHAAGTVGYERKQYGDLGRVETVSHIGYIKAQFRDELPPFDRAQRIPPNSPDSNAVQISLVRRAT